MAIHHSVLGAFAALCLALPVAAEGIEVQGAFARTAYPGAPTGAAFMVIHNRSAAPDQLIEARSAIAARVELHTHIDAGDGILQMREVEDGFPLPSDGQIVMQRGGHHVMMMGVNQRLTPGDMVPITLVFASGTELDLLIEVKADGTGGEGHGSADHSSMDHSSMDHDSTDHDAMDNGAMDHGHHDDPGADTTN